MLNDDERRRTAAELRGNLDAAGLTPAEAAWDLGFLPERLRAVLDVESADPVDVWLLRDYLEQAVHDAGCEPVPFTVLTSDARRRAEGWFRLHDDVPRHLSAPGG